VLSDPRSLAAVKAVLTEMLGEQLQQQQQRQQLQQEDEDTAEDDSDSSEEEEDEQQQQQEEVTEKSHGVGREVKVASATVQGNRPSKAAGVRVGVSSKGVEWALSKLALPGANALPSLTIQG
jgi:hypothetical protein